MTSGGEGRRRSLPTIRLVVDPHFGPFFLGKLVSNLGVWVHQLAAAVVVFDLTGSAAWVGAIGVGQFAPQLLIAPWSGARADHADRRKQLLLGRLIGGSGSASLVVLPFWLSLGDRAGAIAVVVGSTVLGIGFALGGPALHALVPQLVEPRDLPAAITLNTLPITVSRAAGPVLGALILATSGPEAAFLVAALGNYLFAVALLRIRARADATVADGRTPGARPIRDGMRHIREHATLRTLLLGVAVIGFAADPVITLSPSLAALLGGDAGLVGALASGFGAGAALGLMVAGPLRTALGVLRLGPLGILLIGVGYALAGQARNPTLAVLAIGLAGSGMTIGLTSLTTRVQQVVTESFRGRVMAAWSIAFLGTRPLAASTLGPLADVAGVRTALATVGVLCALAAWWVLRMVRSEAASSGAATSDE